MTPAGTDTLPTPRPIFRMDKAKGSAQSAAGGAKDAVREATLRRQPDRLEVPRLGRIPRGSVARLRLLDGEVPDDPCHGLAPT